MNIAVKPKIASNKKEISVEKLKRIEGRIRGLIKMIEDERDCEDILMQISATHEALRVVSKSMIQSYLEHNVPSRLMATSSEKREEAYEELLDMLYKYVK